MQQGERGSISEVSILHLAAGLWALPMEADGGDKSPVHICSLKEKTWMVCIRLFLYSVFPASSSPVPTLLVGLVSALILPHFTGLLPPLATSVTFLPEGRTVTFNCSWGP